MVSPAEIRQQLSRWIGGEISLRQFEDWFVPATWDAHSAEDKEVEALADEIELNLSEFSDSVLSEQELREELTRIADPFREPSNLGRRHRSSTEDHRVPGGRR
jgi:hypothetical protein